MRVRIICILHNVAMNSLVSYKKANDVFFVFHSCVRGDAVYSFRKTNINHAQLSMCARIFN